MNGQTTSYVGKVRRVPWSRACHPPSAWTYFPPQKLPEPHGSEIFMEALSRRHERSFTQSSASLLAPEAGGGAGGSKLLIMTWSFC